MKTTNRVTRPVQINTQQPAGMIKFTALNATVRLLVSCLSPNDQTGEIRGY